MSRGGTFEKRREKRSKRRLRVVLEAEGTRSGGYTTNLSLRGMQVTASVVFPMGSIVRGHIELPAGKQVAIEAKVRWAIKGVGTFATLQHKSMGLQLLGAPSRELFDLLENPREDEARQGSGPTATATTVPAAADRGTRSTAPEASATPRAPAGCLGVRCAEPGIAIGRQGTAEQRIEETGPLTAAAAARLIERAARAALESILTADHETRGVKLVLTIMDTEPLPAGSTMSALARVEALSEGGRFVDLDVDLSELGRTLGRATFTVLVARRPRTE
ncbi:MAG: PilZ domain-containing protein [Deltaproteobacteria bacterium]|nr:PilZ domain-containing protein [Deltaproteobacteria bacterium]